MLFTVAGTGLFAQPSIQLDEFIPDLERPVGIVHAGDGSGRLFIVSQPGRIWIFDGLEILPTPFLDINSAIACCGERGMLGLVFHPDYESNGYFYVNYSNNLGTTVVARYQVDANNPNTANPLSETILLTIDQHDTNHNGGQLQFGPDGFLYIASGDGGGAGDQPNNAQQIDRLQGKLLRIDVNSGSPYDIPADNPFVGVTGLDEIWAYGLRNPWRFSFDRETGDLFIGDVGQGAREEIDFQPFNSVGGENYGWRRKEGELCYNPSSNCDPGGLTDPIMTYDRSGGGCKSVTGGYRYRGAGSVDLYGRYLFADYCDGRIWAATESTGSWTKGSPLLDTSFRISTFGEDEEGELYLADLGDVGQGNGTIYRIRDVTQPVAESVGPASGSGSAGLFSYLVSDTDGYEDISLVQVMINDVVSEADSCLISFTPSDQELRLRNDAGTAWLGPAVIGSAAVLTNVKCEVDVEDSSFSGDGNNLTLNLDIEFFSVGPKRNWLWVTDTSGQTTMYDPVGTWVATAESCPADLVLDEQTLSGTQTLQATTSATLGSNLTVSGPSITIRAPSVALLPDTTITGEFSVSNTTFCP